MEDNLASWTFVDHALDDTGGKIVFQVRIRWSNLTNVVVEIPTSDGELAPWQDTISRFLQHEQSVDASEAKSIIDNVLTCCRLKYGDKGPLLANTLYVKDRAGQPHLVEAMDPDLEEALRRASILFEGTEDSLPLVARTSLQQATVKEGNFLAQTQPVWYDKRIHVAKGPTSAERAYDDLSEVPNLLSLKVRHPNIVPPPTALITLSPEDGTICGFLLPLYKHGSLDRFARKVRSQDEGFECLLWKWFSQLVSAVQSLIEAETYHGDIKPDNILVSESSDVVLIDFSRSATTMPIAGPEVKEGKNQSFRACQSYLTYSVVIKRTRKVCIPPDWPIDMIEKSEVYSIGRTMFFVCQGISMLDVYLKKGPENGEFLTRFSDQSWPSGSLQRIILACVNDDPRMRPSLAEVASMLESSDVENSLN